MTINSNGIKINNNLPYSDYLKLIQQPIIRPLCRIAWLRPEDESEYKDIVKIPLNGSQLTADVSSGTRRSVSLVLDNSNKDFIPNVDTFWMNMKFQLYLGCQDELSNQIWFEQGVFVIGSDNPEIISNYSSKTVNLKCSDKWSLLDIPVGEIYIVKTGEKVTDTIQSILNIVGDKKTPIISDLPDITPWDLRWTEDTTYATIIKDLANLYSREVFYDVTGHLVFQKLTDQNTVETIFDFSPTQFQMGTTRVMQFSNVKNHIYVKGQNSATNVLYSGEASNTDLTSNTCIQVIGEHPLVITDSKVWSDDLCNQRAQFELTQKMRVQESLNLISIPLPHIDVNKAIITTDNSINLNHSRYVIQQFQLPLDLKSSMSTTALLYSDGQDFADTQTISASTNGS